MSINSILLQKNQHQVEAAWKSKASDLAQWATIFINRGSWGYGCYNANGGSFTQKNEALTLDRGKYNLKAHFDGSGLRLGLHAISPTDFTTRWGGIDIDAHGVERKDHRETAQRIARKLMSVGITPIVEDSNGNGGWHIWVIFKTRIPAQNVRRLLMWAADYSDDHEIFPKQDTVKEGKFGEDGFGNFLRLPGKHHKRDHWSNFWDVATDTDFVGADAPEYLLGACVDNDPASIPLEAINYDPPKESQPVSLTLEGAAAGDGDHAWLKAFKGDLKTLRFVDLLADAGLEPEEASDGKYNIVCPWNAEHTSDSGGTAVWWEPGRYPTWKCLHAHCKHRGHVSHLLGALGTDKVDAYCDKIFVTASVRDAALGAAVLPPELAPETETVVCPEPEAAAPAPDDLALFEELSKREPAERAALTELAISNAIIARHSQHLRYCESLRGWLVWDGKRWQTDSDRDGQCRVFSLVERYLKELKKEAGNIADADKRKNAIKEICRYETHQRMAAVTKLMSLNRMVNTTADKFDTHLELLNCNNGVVNLVTGELMPHDPELLMTKISPANYTRKKSEFWEKVVAEYWSDKAVAEYVQTVAGVSITGKQEKLLLFLYGGGDNGKSTFIDAIRHAVGDYASSIRTEALMRKKQNSGINNDIADTRGVRMLLSHETEEGCALDEQLVKVLTGKDVIKARFLYQENFEFVPQFTLWMQGNHKPTITGTDDGIWTRLKLINFSRQFVGAEKVANMDQLLRKEADAILSWIVDGCLKYQREGIKEPESIKVATAEYRKQSDRVGEFIDEMMVEDPDKTVEKSVVYHQFVEWCKRNGYQGVYTHKRFSQQLEDKGWKEQRTKKCRLWCGWSVNVEQASAALPTLPCIT